MKLETLINSPYSEEYTTELSKRVDIICKFSNNFISDISDAGLEPCRFKEFFEILSDNLVVIKIDEGYAYGFSGLSDDLTDALFDGRKMDWERDIENEPSIR